MEKIRLAGVLSFIPYHIHHRQLLTLPTLSPVVIISHPIECARSLSQAVYSLPCPWAEQNRALGPPKQALQFLNVADGTATKV